MQDSWNESDGLLLRNLRERTGMDRSIFARTCSVSVAQLTELEDGGHGHFYTARIKAHVGRGLLRKLGYVHTPAPQAEPPAPSVDPDSVAALATPEPVPSRQAARTEAPALVAKAAPPAAAIELPASRGLPVYSGARLKKSPHVTWVRAGFVAAVAVTLVVILIPRKSRESRLQAEEPVAQASASASAAPAAASIASLALAVPGISEAAASTAQLPASAAVTANAEIQPTTPTTTVQVSATERRCELPPRDKLTEYTPPNALRSNNYVYLESLKDTSVCVVDSQNRQTVSTLKPGEGVSVYGTPPFTVQTRQWADVRMFFQGVRVTLDSATPPVAVLLTPR